MASGSSESRAYKMKMQKVGITLPNQHAERAVPSKANKATHTDPGLGAKTIAHPFQAKATKA